MSAALQFVLNVLRFHKLKIALFVFASLVFAVVIFPYDDLSDYVTTQISAATAQQVYVRFDSMDLDVLPAPGVHMEKVSVETPSFPRLEMAELTLAPSIRSLLSFRPGVAATARDFFGGDVFLRTKTGKVDGQQNVFLESQELSLQKLSKFLKTPVPLKGRLRLNTQMDLDLTMASQPEGDIQLGLDEFQVVSANVPTQLGPINIPDVRISTVSVAGRLSDGRLIIEEAQLGKAGDDISGKVKGEVALRLESAGGTVRALPGAYNLDLDLVVSKGLSEKAGLLLLLLDSYKRADPAGHRYAVRLQGTNFASPPKVSFR